MNNYRVYNINRKRIYLVSTEDIHYYSTREVYAYSFAYFGVDIKFDKFTQLNDHDKAYTLRSLSAYTPTYETGDLEKMKSFINNDLLQLIAMDIL